MMVNIIDNSNEMNKIREKPLLTLDLNQSPLNVSKKKLNEIPLPPPTPPNIRSYQNSTSSKPVNLENELILIKKNLFKVIKLENKKEYNSNFNRNNNYDYDYDEGYPKKIGESISKEALIILEKGEENKYIYFDINTAKEIYL